MNQIEFAEQIEKRYRSYLSTFFHIKDPHLRKCFEEALSKGHLSKGPYLQGTPVFKRGPKLAGLYKELFGTDLQPAIADALTAGRELYLHQERAIRSIASGRNVVVSTGTGSGKTESFLIPIILELYKQFQSRELDAGVRALVLYPMNALANDQRDRLVAGAPVGQRGGILHELRRGGANFSFTVGQYIGETPEDERDTFRKGPEKKAKGMPGELIFRSEMRKTPPNILLTNYSMLEYLLLRPSDSPLFDETNAKSWTFLVLDEAHQYRGARGIEMAMLLRRLKRRLRAAGCANRFRCIATSASLIDEGGDASAVAKFAEDLFDEPFAAQDVILGESEPIQSTAAKQLDLDDYILLGKSLVDDEGGKSISLKEIAQRLDVDLSSIARIDEQVGSILRQDKRVTNLRQAISAKARNVDDLSNEHFSDLEPSLRRSSLANVVQLCLEARDPVKNTPLLSARYHHFLRALEGAFLIFDPKPTVVLDRRTVSSEKSGYELALCKECGQHYIVGTIREGRLVEAVRDPGSEEFGAEFFLPLELPVIDESLLVGVKEWVLCTDCAAITKPEQPIRCQHTSFVKLLQHEESQAGDKAKSCLACDHSGKDPIREVSHGTDGPHAVIATTLYQNLPKDRNKVLAFADGRQEAAYFAWYLDSSYRQMLDRNLILAALGKLDTKDGISIREATYALRDIYQEKQIFPRFMSASELIREAWKALYQEFLTNEQRISLEGVGLVRWEVALPENYSVPNELKAPPWSLSENDARALVRATLDSLRQTRAVELLVDKGQLLSWTDLEMQGSQQCVCIGSPRGQNAVSSWDGKQTRRGNLLRRLTDRLQPDGNASGNSDVLSIIWDSIEEYDRGVLSEERILVSCQGGKRLNPNWLRLYSLHEEEQFLICDKCNKIDQIALKDICTRHRCNGSLKAISRDQLHQNHYRNLYGTPLPGLLRVEEHTAQLDAEKAREFQRDFKEGRIDLLSCSTTFELGVDLGDLDTIFLRNMPPESFNYDQRVGRSGRRPGHAGFALTFCKRGPHDLYHYTNPMRMISGKVKAPVLSLTNEKIIVRHLTAVALSEFFRANVDRFQSVRLLLNDFSHPIAVSDFRKFLIEQRERLQDDFLAILPKKNAALPARLGFRDGSWIDLMTNEMSKLNLAENEVSDDYVQVLNFQQEMISSQNFKAADWAKSRAKTIEDEDVLRFLSRKTVIPKYGFPVDVVELDTHKVTQRNSQSASVELSRDLSIAISEFAPSAKLIANKKEWQSAGIKRVAGKEFPVNEYWRCAKHNLFEQWSPGESPRNAPCPCANHGKYIIPVFGFVSTKEPKEPTGRADRVFSTRPYFVRSLLNDVSSALSLPSTKPIVTVSRTMPGRMVVLCEGKKGDGFSICQTCGTTGDTGSKKKKGAKGGHTNHHGVACNGIIDTHLSLGHEFETDIVRVQFLPEPEGQVNLLSFAYSLASAIVEGAAEVLQVPSSDISVTVGHIDGSKMPPIIVYDNVPGGAGLVSCLEKDYVFQEVLETAKERVGGKCKCGEETSCYGCLRSYRNQFVHEQLRRGPVLEYLSQAIQIIEWQSSVPVGVVQ